MLFSCIAPRLCLDMANTRGLVPMRAYSCACLVLAMMTHQCGASCAAGKIPVPGKAGTCASCPSGRFAKAGETMCSLCPLGTSCEAGSCGTCTACPRGTYADAPGMAVCMTCLGSLNTAGLGSGSSSECSICKQGEYFEQNAAQEGCKSCGFSSGTDAEGPNLLADCKMKTEITIAIIIVAVALCICCGSCSWCLVKSNKRSAVAELTPDTKPAAKQEPDAVVPVAPSAPEPVAPAVENNVQPEPEAPKQVEEPPKPSVEELSRAECPEGYESV